MYVEFLIFPQFSILLTLIIIVEIAAAIAGYIFRNKVSVECLFCVFVKTTQKMCF